MLTKIPEFNFLKATSVDEALRLIATHSNYKLLAGGTDLLMDLRIGRYKPEVVIDISKVMELKYIKDLGDKIAIGSLTTLQEVLESPVVRGKAPVLVEAVSNMASWQIRNMATLGGNLCNASPAADTAPPLMVLNASLKLRSLSKGERVVNVNEFFLGPRQTVLEKGEMLTEVEIPYVKDAGQSYLKLGRRNAFTLSIVSVASLVKVEDGRFKEVRVALNSVAPTPVRARSVEQALIGKEVSYEAVVKASNEVIHDISPISDVRASAEYRRKVSIVLVRDSILKSLSGLGINVR
ncbi:MAG: hypothetical protein B7O98_03890 [Zestosphaera tikiterensis]|uniref:FAD-binding PCMH-type domain-containing protein n=1 Tax=Zestosphaera tikiterensis TaxID=1973259 RepID=A0A2R7Y7R9_9CREN|nr:MAG: hypothetical protein B7O98_03890 [Zestosphaera tikiterensis]